MHLWLLLLSLFASAPRLQDGDIIFQESQSAQSRAIQLATHSPYSHMGLVFSRGGRWYVFEAVGPVQLTPFDAWVRRGRGGHYVVKRLRDGRRLTPAVRRRMYDVAQRYAGKPYDLYFEWSDRRIYCSELVWKVYKQGAGVEIGALQRLGDFDLSDPLVRAKMKERYGARVPTNEPVISPGAMFASGALVEVARR